MRLGPVFPGVIMTLKVICELERDGHLGIVSAVTNHSLPSKPRKHWEPGKRSVRIQRREKQTDSLLVDFDINSKQMHQCSFIGMRRCRFNTYCQCYHIKLVNLSELEILSVSSNVTADYSVVKNIYNEGTSFLTFRQLKAPIESFLIVFLSKWRFTSAGDSFHSDGKLDISTHGSCWPLS